MNIAVLRRLRVGAGLGLLGHASARPHADAGPGLPDRGHPDHGARAERLHADGRLGPHQRRLGPGGPDRRSLLLDGHPEPAATARARRWPAPGPTACRTPRRRPRTARRSTATTSPRTTRRRSRSGPTTAGRTRRRRTRGRRRPGTAASAGGHCIGCHSITNDGKFMALDIGGSSTYNAANWELLDIAAQALCSINPTKTGGNGCNDPNATATNDPTCYWQSYRKDAFATETAWGPNDDVMVSMYKSKLYFNTVAAERTGSATITQIGLRSRPRRRPSIPISRIRSGATTARCWSTPRSTRRAADSTGNPGGLNGDLKTGGQIAIADATPESITDDARVLVPRVSGHDQLLPVRQRGQQLRRLQPEHLRQPDRPTSTTTAAPATAPGSATVTTTRRPSSGGSRPAATGRTSASTTPTAATTTTTTPGRASAPT